MLRYPAFDELVALAELHDARLLIKRESDSSGTVHARCEATFKRDSEPVIKVRYDHIAGAMRELLQKLDPIRVHVVERDRPRQNDIHEIVARATPVQRANLTRLLTQLRELKEEILHPTPITHIEPTLAGMGCATARCAELGEPLHAHEDEQ